MMRNLRIHRLVARGALAVAVLVTLAGCTNWAPVAAPVPGAGTSSSPAPDLPTPARVALPADEVTVVDSADPITASLAVSATLFSSAPVAFVVPAGDDQAAELAAVGAVALGVPVLVGPAPPAATAGANSSASPEPTQQPTMTPSPAPSPPAESSAHADSTEAEFTALRAELDRLQVEQVATVGTNDPADDRAHPWAADWTKQLTGQAREVHQLDTIPQAVNGFVEDWPGQRGAGVTGLTAVSDDSPALIAAQATARAAGGQAHVSTADDPLLTATVMTAVRKDRATHLLAIGDVFAADAAGGMALPWKFEVASSGRQLPGGGGQWFPGHTLVGLYGTPVTSALGVLGEQDLAASLKRAETMAAPYRALTDTTVVPAFEIIATVAAAQAGGDGNYSNELDVDTIFHWAQAADDAGFAVVVDLQPGRSDFLSQAKQYQKVLMLPNVGLALDPEWRLKPKEVPLKQIGQVSAAEVDQVSEWLADLTRDNQLPQKLFVLHQFSLKMLQDRSTIDMSRPELATVIHADGQGSQPAKQETWRALHVDAPPGAFWGWKNFIDEDHPMLTPEETMSGVRPTPNLITYQ
ncbi:hypothetical protein [Homoserinimonas sp. OAct 916]|uniref:hypothetical protein n=1 Tax=Homoserinimonas sp. OAct 916 TaxID=2211450 RepID=UPI00130019A9|nr:hypothetical protein [Homoserinimonas sp. OAct 916]